MPSNEQIAYDLAIAYVINFLMWFFLLTFFISPFSYFVLDMEKAAHYYYVSRSIVALLFYYIAATIFVPATIASRFSRAFLR